MRNELRCVLAVLTLEARRYASSGRGLPFLIEAIKNADFRLASIPKPDQLRAEHKIVLDRRCPEKCLENVR